MKKQTDSDDYLDRMKSVYDRSNEKPRLRAELSKIFKGYRFRNALDIGPGPGEITEVLHQFADDLTLIEITEGYRPILSKKFPQSKVIIDSINNLIPLKDKFDLILYSQGLYYQEESKWFSLCQQLVDSLQPGGSLVVVMCSDSGDYWEVMEHVWREKPELKAYHFMKWSEFVPSLAQLGKLKTFAFEYDSFCRRDEIVDFVGGCMLAIMDRSALEQNRELIESSCSKFIDPDGETKLTIHCGIAVITKPE